MESLLKWKVFASGTDQDKLRLGPQLFAEVVVGGHLVADTHRACVVARVGKVEPVLTQVRAGKGRLRRTTVHNDCDRAVVDVEGYIFGVGQTVVKSIFSNGLPLSASSVAAVPL